jgi:hypothetical protein
MNDTEQYISHIYYIIAFTAEPAIMFYYYKKSFHDVLYLHECFIIIHKVVRIDKTCLKTYTDVFVFAAMRPGQIKFDLWSRMNYENIRTNQRSH